MGNFVRTMLFVYMEFISCELFVGILRKEKGTEFLVYRYCLQCCLLFRCYHGAVASGASDI